MGNDRVPLAELHRPPRPIRPEPSRLNTGELDVPLGFQLVAQGFGEALDLEQRASQRVRRPGEQRRRPTAHLLAQYSEKLGTPRCPPIEVICWILPP